MKRDSVTIGGSTLADLNRLPAVGARRLASCAVCGQDYDPRRLGDTLFHTTIPDHEPLEGDD